MEDILQFFSDNKDALTAIGIILTFLVSITSLYFSARNNKAVHYVNAITKNRVEWIQKMREVVSNYISKSKVEPTLMNKKALLGKKCQNFDELVCELSILQNELVLLLNPIGVYDKNIINESENILHNVKRFYYLFSTFKEEKSSNNKIEELFNICTYIERDSSKMIKDVQIYLKSEWNRVKYESQGKTYEKIVQDFDLEELKEKYDNPGYKNKIWKRRFIVLWAKIKKLFPICIVVDFLSFLGAKFKRG